MISLAQLARPFLENSTQGSPSSTTSSHLLDYLVIPCLMSQSTYREHDVRSTLSYQERETAIFGSSSSGSDYDTEDGRSQPTTDDGSVDHVEEATVPSRPVPRRDRDQSPVTVRYGSPQGHVPRRPRDLSPVSVRYVPSQVRGPD
jgi:hypothetical protein